MGGADDLQPSSPDFLSIPGDPFLSADVLPKLLDSPFSDLLACRSSSPAVWMLLKLGNVVLQLFQKRGLASKERSRAPATPVTSKVKKYKIKGYSYVAAISLCPDFFCLIILIYFSPIFMLSCIYFLFRSFKSRFRTMNDGNIRRWRAGKRHNAHLKVHKPCLFSLLFFLLFWFHCFCYFSSWNVDSYAESIVIWFHSLLIFFNFQINISSASTKKKPSRQYFEKWSSPWWIFSS